jgi:protein-S-isoprenylcysteine O-methyltransferase Ste14
MAIFVSNWGGSNAAERRQPALARLIQRVLLIAAVVFARVRFPLPVEFNHDLWPASQWQLNLGVAAAYVGCFLISWARVTIGGNYNTDIVTSQGQHLVTKGPYGLMRHPIYTGLLIAIVGTALTPPTPVKLMGVAFALIFVLWRTLAEDVLLAKRFGSDFDSYRRKVRALVPLLL